MQVGTPGQNLRLIPSNSGNAVWPVLPQGCMTRDPAKCGDSRGYLFQPNASSTWNSTGIHGLVLTEEAELGYRGSADFGYDDLTLGRPGDGLPTLDHQVIEGFAVRYKGILYRIVRLKSSRYQYIYSQQPSAEFLWSSSSAEQNPKHFVGLHSRCLLQAANSIWKSNIRRLRHHAFCSEQRNILVWPRYQPRSPCTYSIHHIRYRVTTFNSHLCIYRLTRTSHLAPSRRMSSTFEQAFGLVYNETAEIYFVNDTLHDKLISQNPNVTFTLGPASGGATVDIVMQYGSFDLLAEYPIINNATRYFPLERAQNDSQFTLGRTFLQDAYVIADYDRNNFSVSQAIFPNISNTQQIVAIRRPEDSLLPTHHKTLSTGTIVGIVLGGIMSSLILGTIIVYSIHKRVQKRSINSSARDRDESEYRKGELECIERSRPVEMPVAEPKELTAVEARRPELSAQILYEMLEPPTELEGPSFVHTEHIQESDNPCA